MNKIIVTSFIIGFLSLTTIVGSDNKKDDKYNEIVRQISKHEHNIANYLYNPLVFDYKKTFFAGLLGMCIGAIVQHIYPSGTKETIVPVAGLFGVYAEIFYKNCKIQRKVSEEKAHIAVLINRFTPEQLSRYNKEIENKRDCDYMDKTVRFDCPLRV